MRKVLLVLILFAGWITPSSAQSFPQRVEGTWKGMMHIWSKGILMDSVGIIFTVQPFPNEGDQWIWKIEYVSDKMPLIKDYTLVQSQNQPNEFLMNEGDGVVLTNYVFGNKMYSLFKVKKYWLTASYELLNDLLIFEVTSGEVSKVKSKGVTNCSFDFVQRVVLKKIQL